MTTRKRAPWLAAAALSLSLGPAAASAQQDPTQYRQGDLFRLDVENRRDTLIDELGADTERQLEEQRRLREEQEATQAENERRALAPQPSEFDMTPGFDATP
jgi:hypothetical protein